MLGSPERAGRRVSIVMPTFNRVQLLRGAIAHCLAQTYGDIELIVVDDGCSDGTGEMVRSLKEGRVVYVRHERNRGLPEALNSGFRRATGAYLTWGSDDDRFAPDAIAELVGYLEQHPEVGLVYADYWVIDAAGRVVGQVDVRPPAALAQGNCVNVCRLYRREVYEAVGDYDPATRLAEDYDYWLRVAARFRLAPLHRRLYYRREHADSLTGRFTFEAQRMGERVKLAHGWTTPTRSRRALERIDVCAALARRDRIGALRRGLQAIVRDLRHLASRDLLSTLLTALIGEDAHQRLRVLRGKGPQDRDGAPDALLQREKDDHA